MASEFRKLDGAKKGVSQLKSKVKSLGHFCTDLVLHILNKAASILKDISDLLPVYVVEKRPVVYICYEILLLV